MTWTGLIVWKARLLGDTEQQKKKYPGPNVYGFAINHLVCCNIDILNL